MNHSKILQNKADRTTFSKNDSAHSTVACEGCNEEIIFAMEDNFHQFSIGLRTILQCLKVAETEGHVLPLPAQWWTDISNRHKMFEENFVYPQRE
ncbi:XRE family transcriptional regulator [Halodesulfovibrio aestuarii]|uniref:XRE family transcriptional regulator n=1 Tax=Halodesulfovibrio aestuarii TaxID=126333 RepID=A0ABV4JWF4_9BACT